MHALYIHVILILNNMYNVTGFHTQIGLGNIDDQIKHDTHAGIPWWQVQH